MSDVSIRVENDLAYDSLLILHRGMTRAMAEEVGDLAYDPLVLTARDAAGDLVGGLRAATFWRWLGIDLFWVAPAHQRRGLGSELLRRAESEAVRRGCVGAHFDTFSTAALRFYERAGYGVVATVAAEGAVTRYSLRKLFASP